MECEFAGLSSAWNDADAKSTPSSLEEKKGYQKDVHFPALF